MKLGQSGKDRMKFAVKVPNSDRLYLILIYFILILRSLTHSNTTLIQCDSQLLIPYSIIHKLTSILMISLKIKM